MSVNPRQHIRRRASSVSQALSAIPLNNAPHNEKVPSNAASSSGAASTFETGASVLINPSLQLNGSVDSFAAAQEIADKAIESQLRQRRATSENPKTTGNTTPSFRKQQLKLEDRRRYESDGLWRDVRSGKWMLIPSSSFKLLALPVLFYLNHRYILTNPALPMPSVVRQLLPLDSPNFWKPLVLLSGLDRSDSSSGYLYKRDVRDLAFIAYYIVVFSFIRQFITLQILRPLASRLGVARGKTERFTEQGYAFVYFGFFGILGILVMRGLPTWWYSTSAFWTTFPVLRMPGTLKAYYLLQASYWCQQTIILAAGVEKPRKDFKELIAHHLVTLWLIGWSYLLTLTYIGVAIFVTMDVSDIFLALAKCVNYVNEDASAPVFAFFVVIWTYMRHYLNIKILYSVWTEFELIPKWARVSFRPWKETELMAGWMKYQIFAPILLLQGLNLFWWFLIMRILFRAIFSKNLADERSDGEEEEEELDVHADLNGALKVD